MKVDVINRLEEVLYTAKAHTTGMALRSAMVRRRSPSRKRLTGTGA